MVLGFKAPGFFLNIIEWFRKLITYEILKFVRQKKIFILWPPPKKIFFRLRPWLTVSVYSLHRDPFLRSYATGTRRQTIKYRSATVRMWYAVRWRRVKNTIILLYRLQDIVRTRNDGSPRRTSRRIFPFFISATKQILSSLQRFQGVCSEAGRVHRRQQR